MTRWVCLKIILVILNNMLKFLHLGKQISNPFTYHYLTDPQSKLTPTQRQWTKQMVNISVPAVSAGNVIRVVFQLISTVPSTYLAIDDITYRTGLCTSALPTPPPLGTTPPTMEPSLTLACDFEGERMCNWKNDPVTPWKIESFIGNIRDHTGRSAIGSFAYVQHTSMDSNKAFKKAFMSIIDYGVAGSGGAVCFRLWYQMKSRGYSRLNVTITAPDNTIVAMTAREYSQGEQWNQLELEVHEQELGHMSYNFSISAQVNYGKC